MGISNFFKKLLSDNHECKRSDADQREMDRLQDAIEHANEENQRMFYEMERLRTQWADSQNKLMKYQTEATAGARRTVDLEFTEIKGNAPILWINSPDPSVVNQGTFANIRDRLRRLAPGIEMIILTYGDVKLLEMKDEDLNRIGLARIKDHRGGEVGGPSTRLEHKKASG